MITQQVLDELRSFRVEEKDGKLILISSVHLTEDRKEFHMGMMRKGYPSKEVEYRQPE